MPSGPQWHRDLLSQLSVEFPGTRPAVLQHSSRACLDEYRGLRHVVRKFSTGRFQYNSVFARHFQY
ncbi:MAG: hypothetical protein HC929_03305 [Leptolyngbyaceae cyanobacterium SM2_5_2]|nr:hypothetical protein [Leptolyngbyaceae cyanobacterium SM2_5_2]